MKNDDLTLELSRRRTNRLVGIPRTALAVAGLVCSCGAMTDSDPPVVEVERGPFDVFVVEQAELAARSSVTIASELPSNMAKIAWLVADGSMVEEGDLIVRFDAEPFREEAARAQREHEDARAALLQAEAELQILVRRAAELDETLAHQIEIARLELEHFRKADRVLRLVDAENAVLVARTALEQARQEADTQRRLAAEGFGSAALHSQAEAVEREKQSAVALSERNATLLETVVLPSEERRAELELARKEREREATQHTTLHGLAKQRAAILALENRVATFAAALEVARARLNGTEVRAPVAGFAILVPTSVGTAFRKVQVGDSVWHRHGFVVIPDMSALVADVRVRETDIGMIEVGQPVALHPQAFPDVSLKGRVETMGTLAESTGANDGNEFSVRISVEGDDARLRPGMHARAEILARRFTDVLRVPVETVFRDAGESVCFVWNRGRAERRRVELGDSDGAHIVILRGLRAGERVLLAYPGAAVTQTRARSTRGPEA